MSQCKQATSKKNDPLQAKKIFEDDIGDDFLSSWKPSTQKTDTDLDFGSENTPKAKKSSFSLDKFDVDFDFDGGFGNLSTFNVDMSDLDFRSPPSKTQKSKAKSQETSQEKKAGFEFEFDFQGLDGFDLDSTLLKGKEDKKNPVQEKSILPSNDKNESISESKSKVDAGKEEKKNSVPEKPPVLSSETSDSVSESRSKEIFQNVNNKSESHDSEKLTKQPTLGSKFNLSEFNMDQADSEDGVTSKSLAQSPCTSGFQHLEIEQCKETSPDKQSIIEGAHFGNLHQTGYSNTVKKTDHLTESEYSDKIEMFRSEGSAISRNVDNCSENHDNGTVPKEPTVPHSNFKLSEFRKQEIDFQRKSPPKFLAQSQCASGCEDVVSKQHKQASTDNPGFRVDNCFGNLLQTGDAKGVKQTYNLTECKYFDKAVVSKSESKGSSQNVGNSLGGHDDVTVSKQPMVANTKFKGSELSIEEMNSHHGFPPKSLDDSPCTSGSQEIGTKHIKQSSAYKQHIAVDTSFENMPQTDDSNTVKWTSNLTDSVCSEKVASSPTSSYHSGSRDELSSHKVLPFKNRHASKDPQGDKDQILVQTGSFYKKMEDSDSASKNSSPTKLKHSKHNHDNKPDICAITSSGMMMHDGNIDSLAQKDVNDNTRGRIDQCQYGQDFEEYQSTLPTVPDSSRQREITSQRSVATKYEFQLKENITDQMRKQEFNLRTKDSVSKTRENVLQGLNKICQPTSLANDRSKVAMERNSSAAQSNSCLDPQKSLSETTEYKNSVGNNPLQESSKLIISGGKSTSVMIPQKHTQHLPTLQASRPNADGKSMTLLKQTNERLFSPKPTIGVFSDKSLPKKILSLPEQKNTFLSPFPPLKRKPIEKSIAELNSMNPLKRISGCKSLTEKKLADNVRKSQIQSPRLEQKIRDLSYKKTPVGHSLDSLLGTYSEEKPSYNQKLEKYGVQEEGLQTDTQAEVSGSIVHTDEQLDHHSPFQKFTRHSEDVSMLENDDIDNVEKADSCSRDLEEMYEMLKQKHEEAKDLFVRAIVMNHWLLMLNHPMQEEKLQAIEKYVVCTFPKECTK